MEIIVTDDPVQLGKSAGKAAAELIKHAIEKRGQANIILATGASQFETLKQLVLEKDVDWSKVVMFHLDEYIGLPESSNASFRKYLKERFLKKVPHLKGVYLVNGKNDRVNKCQGLNSIIKGPPIDVFLVGVGKNGPPVLNDPPADLATKDPF